jgi:Outer membrane protein beta-barrel domain
MKILLKITLAIVLVTFFAQNSFAQVAFGVKAGLNLSNMQLSGDDDDDAKAAVGFNAGLIIEAPISEKFTIRTGLEIQKKGFKSNFSDSTFSLKASVSPIYAQIPVVFAYTGSSFYVGAGPYLGVGVAGKSKVKSSGLGSGFDFDDTEKIKFGGKGDDTFSLLDYGVRLEGGLKLNQIRLGLSLDVGLANAIAKDAREDGQYARHGVFGLSFGYMF